MKSKNAKKIWTKLLALILVVVMVFPIELSAASKVKLNKSSIVLSKNQSYMLKVSDTKVKPKWSTSDKKKVTVTSKGKVTAQKEGVATVTAKVGSKKYKCTVTVVNASYKICLNNTYTIKTKGLKGKIVWKSSNKKYVEVNSKGRIKGKRVGEALITAKAGKRIYRIKVTVLPTTISNTKKTIEVGIPYQLKLKKISEKIRWYSSNVKIASVSSKGIVKGIAPGRATITAKIAQGSLSCSVTVKKMADEAHKHQWEKEIVKNVGCDEEGKILYTCKVCKKTYTELINPLGHTFKNVVIVPTCTTRGYTNHVCTRDVNHSYISDYVPAKGHSWSEEIILEEATRLKNGKKEKKCIVCGKNSVYEYTFERKIALDKKVYEEGEDIFVTAEGDVGNWVGLYAEADNVYQTEPIYSYYVSDSTHKSGQKYCIQEQKAGNRFEASGLPTGKYKIILFRNDLYDIVDYDYFTLKGSSKSRLVLDKEVYSHGEDINVTAIGSGSAWVGIYLKTDMVDCNLPGGTFSIYWYYVNKDGQKSGNTYAINKIGIYNSERAEHKTLPPGEYKICLMADEGYTIIEEKYLTIEPAGEVMPPVGVTYELENPTDGLANGKVTVQINEEDKGSTDILMYWADENGPLAEYTSLAQHKITGKITEIQMYKNTIIPEGATKLLVYTKNDFEVSKECVVIDLPKDCNFNLSDETPLAEFEVVSDVHITDRSIADSDYNKKNNEHFVDMLQDVVKNDPNTQGVFVVGDTADTGREAEYIKMRELIASVNNAPEIHLALGNHDLSGGSYQEQVKLFTKYAGLNFDKAYYDKTINGYHYIMMASESNGLHASISTQQLAWLDNLLRNDTQSDPNKPVFLMLHQSLYNTVAGSFEGQGWNGIDDENGLRAILKKYPQVIFFNGHSHWTLNSEGCMYERDGELPTIFNTASVGYLWNSYDIVTGESEEGSHGYFVKVYKDKVMVMGREFHEGKYIPSAMFMVENYK